MGTSSQSDLKTVLRIDFPNGERIGRGKMQLLEHIRSTGSISAAGRAMNMSYRRAWLLVSAMNGMFSLPVVDLQRGGKQGGGAVVTGFGEELLSRFRAMEEKIETAVADDLGWLDANRAKQATGDQ
ncbi:winged helix-turn-helix domain-containing protein [Phyllobacterium sp. A18/5-2]|uniref:winged helix-turn-helix domain-containing protein n=1 Tax=Phyllobacterium sp. A18/5-2 TaxID=2978392 RepID=UPI0021C6323A|nr:winged helix-turn-helix domain-containing protein [Phyllobacterium sp. A18/5-2]UXN64795.1 winged helix-turn-helix domain-containing protein [Phyllobacterium sp. A18/5-2]